MTNHDTGKVDAKKARIIVGDCLEVLKGFESDSIDSLVTDPPYFLTNDGGNGFMGKEWDSLSPANAIAESYFKSMRLDLNTVEVNAAPRHVSTHRIEESSADLGATTAQLVDLDSVEHPVTSNLRTSFAPEHVITKEEALDLCGVWCPGLIEHVEKLPSNARLVACHLFTERLQGRNTAQIVADILLDVPAWLEAVTTFSNTAKIQLEKSSTGETSGTSLEGKSTSATTGHAVDAKRSATGHRYSVTTSTHTRSLEIISRIISLPSVKAVIKECTKSPSFIPTLSEVFHRKWAREVFRVLNPGAHGLVFNGTRTYHRMVSALEDEGFQVRDTICWLYGQGFPKSLNIEKSGAGQEWAGWGTALKPAHEPIVLIRKPISEKNVASNVLKHGTGAINIDGCRIEGVVPQVTQGVNSNGRGFKVAKTSQPSQPSQLGRFPANLVLSHSPHCTDDQCDIECAIKALDEQTKDTRAGKPSGSFTYREKRENIPTSEKPISERGQLLKGQAYETGDVSGASRFFYCAKISPGERNAGLEGMPKKFSATMNSGIGQREHDPNEPRAYVQNHHPTVKPQKLMRYLCKLVTPPGGLVLDPFMGSGSTGLAALSEGFRFIGIEREPEYFEIAEKRIFNHFPEAKKEVQT